MAIADPTQATTLSPAEVEQQNVAKGLSPYGQPLSNTPIPQPEPKPTQTPVNEAMNAPTTQPSPTKPISQPAPIKQPSVQPVVQPTQEKTTITTPEGTTQTVKETPQVNYNAGVGREAEINQHLNEGLKNDANAQKAIQSGDFRTFKQMY